MVMQAAVHRLQLALHLADTRGQRVDELATQDRHGLLGGVARLLLITAQLIGLDLADQLFHPRLDLAQRLALDADLRADAERVEIFAQRLAHAALDPAALGIGGCFARVGLAGHDAMAFELALLGADSREALAMRSTTLDAIVERPRVEQITPE